MQADDGFDDVQPQADAVFIEAAGGVAFIETLENVGHFPRRDTDAAVAHGTDHPPGLPVNPQRNRPALVGELHRVVEQVVNHLTDQVVVGRHVLPLAILKIDDGDFFVFDALLKGQQGVAGHLGQIELHGGELELSVVDTGKVEHRLDQTGKPLDLVRDDF